MIRSTSDNNLMISLKDSMLDNNNICQWIIIYTWIIFIRLITFLKNIYKLEDNFDEINKKLLNI